MPSREGTLGRIKSHHTTAEYVRGYEAAGLAKPELARYCDGCGRLPAWCSCGKVTFSPQALEHLGRPMREGDTVFCDGTAMIDSAGTLVLDARPTRKEGP